MNMQIPENYNNSVPIIIWISMELAEKTTLLIETIGPQDTIEFH